MIKILRDFASRMDRSDGDAGAAFVELALTMPVLARISAGRIRIRPDRVCSHRGRKCGTRWRRVWIIQFSQCFEYERDPDGSRRRRRRSQRTYHDILGKRNLLKRGCLHRDWRRLPEYGLPKSRSH